VIEILVSILILVGALFTFIGSLGLVRLPDFYSRLHAPTKATTLGVGSLLLASALWFSVQGEAVSVHELLIVLFLFITAPIGAHLLAKAALHLRLKGQATPPVDRSQSSADQSQG
jgi:multicomponent K+:H+ antiporter subunit G